MFMIKSEIKQAMLENLNAKSSSIANCIVELSKQGYSPNNAKLVKLNWLFLMQEAIKQDSFYNEEQVNNIKIIYNKLIH